MEKELNSNQLTMKEAQLVNQEDAQIVSKIDSTVKFARDTTITPFETTDIKGVIRPLNHYK